MRHDRDLAFQLRRQKKSFNEISNTLRIPKSTLHYWFKGSDWSAEVKNKLNKKIQKSNIKRLKLMTAVNKEKWETWHEQCRQEAITEFPDLKKDALFASGLMLYWGEGDKVLKNGLVRIANSDSELIKIFYLFLHLKLGVPKDRIFVKVTLYPDLVDETVKNFWSSSLMMPLSQFKSSIVIQGRHPTKRLLYGTASLEVSSRKLKEKIFAWIRLYQKEFSINQS